MSIISRIKQALALHVTFSDLSVGQQFLHGGSVWQKTSPGVAEDAYGQVNELAGDTRVIPM